MSCGLRTEKSDSAPFCFVVVDPEDELVWMCLPCAVYKTSCSFNLDSATGKRGVISGPESKLSELRKVSHGLGRSSS